jgi:hypothetical protein
MSDSAFTTFLFASPSYLEGLSRILDFGDTFTDYNYSLTDQQADRIAIRSDWRAVGRDIGRVVYEQLRLDLGAAA